MLTRPVAAVKFGILLTPEQAACEMKIDEGLKTFWNVVEHMQHAADGRQPIHQVEETIFRDLGDRETGCSKRSWIWPVLGTSAHAEGRE